MIASSIIPSLSCRTADYIGQMAYSSCAGSRSARLTCCLADARITAVQEPTTRGAAFARALADKDQARILDLMHPEIDFRALTPSRAWEANGRDAVVAVLFEQWFEPSDEIKALQSVETDAFADRERVGYRFDVTSPDGDFVVEQQAYLAEREGRIGWMRVVCSGFRPSGQP
jgi:hypothetical protein